MTLEVCDYLGEPVDNGRDTLYIGSWIRRDGDLAFNIHSHDTEHDSLLTGDTVYIEGTYFKDLNASNSILTKRVTSTSGIKVKNTGVSNQYYVQYKNHIINPFHLKYT